MACEIMRENKLLILTGSLALVMRGHKLRRQPKDIDFLYPYDKGWEKPKDWFDAGGYDYPIQNGFEPKLYVYQDVEINVMIPNQYINVFNIIKASTHGFPRWVREESILRFKTEFAFNEDDNPTKHREDLAYFFTNNTRL